MMKQIINLREGFDETVIIHRIVQIVSNLTGKGKKGS